MKTSLFFVLSFFLCHTDLLSQERTYIEIDLLKENEFNLSDLGFFKIHSLEMNKRGDIVLFNFGESEIIHFDLTTFEAKTFGKGKGRGPGEFKSVMNLKLDNENIIISDVDKGSLIFWNLDGDFLQEIKVGERFISASRIAPCSNDKSIFILSGQYSPNGSLHYFDEEIIKKKSFLKIDKKDERLPYYTDGSIFCDGEGDLFYAYRYVNSIKKCSKNGKKIFDIPVYGFKPNEKIMEQKGRWFSPAEGVRRASGDIAVIENLLFVGYSDSKYNESKWIDVYDKTNGEYKFSINPPNKFLHQ